MYKLLSIVLITMISLGNCVPLRASEDPAVSAARLRAETCKTVEIRFRQTETVMPGGLSGYAPVPVEPAHSIPKEKTVIESTNRIVFDGQKIRYEDNHPSWSRPGGVTPKGHAVYVVDGTLAKVYYPTGAGNEGHQTGFIDGEMRLPMFVGPQLQPIMWTFRGVTRGMTTEMIAGMKPSGQELQIDGAPAASIASMRVQGRMSGCGWISKSSTWSGGNRSCRNGALFEQIDIDYLPEKTAGWVPSKWVCRRYSPSGALLSSEQLEPLEIHINEIQPASQFDMPFPPGTQVADNRNQKWYQVNEHGDMDENSPAPKPASHPYLPWSDRSLWLVWCSLIVAASIVAYAAWKRASSIVGI